MDDRKNANHTKDNPVEDRIEELIRDMTPEEKVSLCYTHSAIVTGGVERLGIPPLAMTDGPQGIREEMDNQFRSLGLDHDAGTYFTSPIALAATWNPALAEELGKALGQEARARGKDILLAPGINIIRTPLCGRNFEYYSEDPYLVASLAVPFIRGVQSQDIAACVKHYALNNSETNRLRINVEVDERALREIYLPGFQAAVCRGKTLAVMGAYNKFRGRHCCENEYLLIKILREEWGFEGIVISDLGAVHDAKSAANSGLDIEMIPFDEKYGPPLFGAPLLEAVQKGLVKKEVIEEKARRILRLQFKLNMYSGKRATGSFNTPEHQALSRSIARESITLLKNNPSILPFDETSLRNLAVIGDNAVRLHARGGGSAAVKALYEISPLEGLRRRLAGKVKVNFAQGYAPADSSGKLDALLNRRLQDEAVALAGASDAVVVFGGLNHFLEREDGDLPDIKPPFGQAELIEKILRVNKRTVVVMVSAAPLEMDPWIHQAPAVIQAFYGGMEGGHAMAEVLFGDVNPSGKLPVTFPKRLGDSPAHFAGEYPGCESIRYREGIFVGYRFFDKQGIEPLFCFGHGISYTTFRYEDLRLELKKGRQGAKVNVSFRVTNTGRREGAEVAQIYVRDMEASVPRPEKELKGFEKVFLKAGETRKVTLALDETAFAFFDGIKNTWVLEPGIFEIMIGSSSRDIRLRSMISLS